MTLHHLVSKHALISDQVTQTEVSVVLTSLERLLATGTRGTIVEFGCYLGTTSLFIRRLLDAYAIEDSFHVYDSFAGLPDKTAQDMSVAGDQFQKGELAATKKQFLQQFYRAHLKAPIVHKAWFGDLGSSDVPDNIIFAFLDGDYYHSIRDSLRLITPKLAPGAVIIVDDYAHEALPGASRAVDEWCRDKTVTLSVEASLAIIVAA
jgi:O-methyltransferase